MPKLVKASLLKGLKGALGKHEPKPPPRSIDEQLNAEQEVVTRRIDWVPAQLPDNPVLPTAKLLVLNPKAAGAAGRPGAAAAASAMNGGGGAKAAAAADAALPAEKHLFPPDRLEGMLRWKQISGVGAGLDNLGNTCFMNSVLQCLTYTPPLANLCKERAHSRVCTRRGGFCVYCEVEGHLRSALDGRSRESISPRVLAGRVRTVAKHFQRGRQEDAHEYFICLLEALQAASLRKASAALPQGEKLPESIAATSEIGQIFCGRLRSQVVCAECSHRSPSYESFFDLSLELRKAGSVSAALKQFTASEKLHGANRYKCPACSKLVNATKQLLLHRTPHVLALQLKRFGFGRYGGGKISRPIPFEEAIDLSPYCTAEAKRAASVRYKLYGVLVHEGPSVHAGHYYSYVRAANGQWYNLDDSYVRQVKASSVLKEPAYILFYQREATPASKPATAGGAATAAATAPSASPRLSPHASPLWAPTAANGVVPELPSSSEGEGSEASGGGSDGSEGSGEESEEESDDEDYEEGESEESEEEDDEESEEESSEEESEEESSVEEPPPRRRPQRASAAAASAYIAEEVSSAAGGEAAGGEAAGGEQLRAAEPATAAPAAGEASGPPNGRSSGSRRGVGGWRKRLGKLGLTSDLNSRGLMTVQARAERRARLLRASRPLRPIGASAAAPTAAADVPKRRIVPTAVPAVASAATNGLPPSNGTPHRVPNGAPAALTNGHHAVPNGVHSPAPAAQPGWAPPAKRPHSAAGAARRPFGDQVGTWDDVVEPASAPRSAGPVAGAKRERASYDFYDREIDRGHVRKTKALKAANREEKAKAKAGWRPGGGGGAWGQTAPTRRKWFI